MAIAFLSTWTTYGTWLPGDERGWFQRNQGIQAPDLIRRFDAALRQTEDAIVLDIDQRRLVEKTIADHCAIRGWNLHAVNCRSNHVHVIVTAANRALEIPREQFKSWCTRKLKDRERLLRPNHPLRANWWTERGWDEYIDDDDFLLNAITYVRERQ